MAVAVRVGVLVAAIGVEVLVGVRVRVAVAVAVFVGVLIAGSGVGVLVGVRIAVGVGVGVPAPPATVVVTLAELLDMTGSNWLPITPATMDSGPLVSGVTLIVTLAAPVAGHVTVVDGSPEAAFATQPAEEAGGGLNVTAGVKTAVTVTPVAPGTLRPIRKLPGTPTAGLGGGVMPVTDRSRL